MANCILRVVTEMICQISPHPTPRSRCLLPIRRAMTHSSPSLFGLVEVHILPSPTLPVLNHACISNRNQKNIQFQLSTLFSAKNTRQDIRHGPKSDHTTRSSCLEDHPQTIYVLADSFCKLNDPSLFKQNVAYVNGEWVKAKSGKTFEVHGESSSPVL